MNRFLLKSLIVFTAVVSWFNYSLVFAQVKTNSDTKSGGCAIVKIELQKDGKPTAETSIKASQVKKYQIIVSVEILAETPTVTGAMGPCNDLGSINVKYEILDKRTGFGGIGWATVREGYLAQNLPVGYRNAYMDYNLESSDLKSYRYSVEWQQKNNVVKPKASIFVTLTDDKGNTSTAPVSSAPDTKVTNTNTVPPNNSKDNKDINTGVSAKFDNSLDTVIGSFNNPLTKDTLPELLGAILKILFTLIGIISVIIIIIAGFRMVIASGNEAELTKAKAAITWAIIGLIVSLMSFSIVAIIQRLIQAGA